MYHTYRLQAERYREALSDLRYILRLEAPPVKGVAVSDDILAVQKMAKECEQKVREIGCAMDITCIITTNRPWAMPVRLASLAPTLQNHTHGHRLAAGDVLCVDGVQ